MNQRETALEILYKTISDESYSNLLMRRKLNGLEPIQRAFCTNLVNGVLRKYELLEYQYEDEIKDSTSLRLRLILSMALYERFFLNEKDYVVNNEYVELAQGKYEKSFVNALLRKLTEFKEPDDEHIRACLPEWLYRVLKAQYDGETLGMIIDMYQSIPCVYYRLNKSKASFDDLKQYDIDVMNDDIFTCGRNLLDTEGYRNGLFYVQDLNSSSLYRHLDLRNDHTLL
ncbi:MAG: hypothetical protein IKX97_05505, partial [Erysipelotrichaceae bacterium]|nr:hypothetical protein [Erysipelotrichaceae bacterium]